MRQQYTRESLLSFADLECCKTKPSGLDPAIWRENGSSELVSGGIPIPVPSRVSYRKDRESDSNSRYSQDIPEWRRGSVSQGSLPHQVSRRKLHDEEAGGHSFSGLYTKKGASNWGEGNHQRSTHDRNEVHTNGGQSRWEHRSNLAEHDKDRNRHSSSWESDESEGILSRSYEVNSSSRSGWTSSEHDGLLGSGRAVFSGRGRGGRSTANHDPFHHPKGPGSRHENSDLVNDETFGLEGNSVEETTEQERKRRESFEQMRKEQQLLKEKQRLQLQESPATANGTVKSSSLDIDAVWDSSYAKSKQVNGVPAGYSASSSKSTTLVASATRPLVPPGFSQPSLQRSSSNKAAVKEVTWESCKAADVACGKGSFMEAEAEAQITEINDANNMKSQSSIESLGVKSNSLVSGMAMKTLLQDCSGEIKQIYRRKVTSIDNAAIDRSFSSDATNEWSMLDIQNDKMYDGHRLTSFDDSNSRSGSVLDKLFIKANAGSQSSNGPHCSLESNMHNDHLSPKVSKFSQWFHVDDDRKAAVSNAIWHADETRGKVDPCTVAKEFQTSPCLSGLSATSVSPLCLPASNCYDDKLVSKPEQAKDLQEGAAISAELLLPLRSQGRVLPMPAGPSLEDIEKSMAASAICMLDKGSHEPDAVPLTLQIHQDCQADGIVDASVADSMKKCSQSFLTCEDIEQSLLAEVSKGTSHHSSDNISTQIVDVEGADAIASKHLLSLLQKGGDAQFDISSSESESVSELNNSMPKPSSETGEAASFSTLGVLFGKAFMKELHSTQFPVSLKSSSSGDCIAAPLISPVDPPLRSSWLDGENPSISDKQNFSDGYVKECQPDARKFFNSIPLPGMANSSEMGSASFRDHDREHHMLNVSMPFKTEYFSPAKYIQDVPSMNSKAKADDYGVGYEHDKSHDTFKLGANLNDLQFVDHSIDLAKSRLENTHLSNSRTGDDSVLPEESFIQDFMKFKKDMQENEKTRNVLAEALGLISNSREGVVSDAKCTNTFHQDVTTAEMLPVSAEIRSKSNGDYQKSETSQLQEASITKGALYRSHSPVSALNGKSSSVIPIHQLQQALVSEEVRTTTFAVSPQQFHQLQKQNHQYSVSGSGSGSEPPQGNFGLPLGNSFGNRFSHAHPNHFLPHGNPIPLPNPGVYNHGWPSPLPNHFIPPGQTYLPNSAHFAHERLPPQAFAPKQRPLHPYYGLTGPANMPPQNVQLHAPPMAGFAPAPSAFSGHPVRPDPSSNERWYARDGAIQQRTLGGFP